MPFPALVSTCTSRGRLYYWHRVSSASLEKMCLPSEDDFNVIDKYNHSVLKYIFNIFTI